MAIRYKAMLNDFALELETIQDNIEKAIAVQEFPYRNGASTEDLSETARRIRFRSHWFNASYDAHFAMREELRRSDLFRLVHPIYGTMLGRVASISVNHADEPEHAVIDFEFIEDVINSLEPERRLSIAQAIEESFVAGQVQQMDAFKSAIRTELGPEAGGILAQTIEPDQGILVQLSGLSASARSYLLKIDRAVALCEGALSSIEQPADSVIATIDYGLTLPGRVVGSMAKMVERYAIMVSALRESPAKFLDALRFNFEKLEDSFVDLLIQLRLAGAQRLALEAAKAFEADEDLRRAYRKQDSRPVFDSRGQFIQPPFIGPIMTVPEAEAAIMSVREYMQVALDGARINQALKNMARDLVTHISNIKFEYEKIKDLSIDTVLPIHLVCLKAGLPYSAAPRLLALNPKVRRPNFVSGVAKVYAR